MGRSAKPSGARASQAAPVRERPVLVEGSGASRSLDRENGVQVVARSADILRALKRSPGGLTQAEIADRLGLARTTVHRILNALAAEGMVQPSGRGYRYRIGPEILQMAEAARSGLVTEIHPFLLELSRELHETVDLSVFDNTQMTFIDQVVAPQRLRAVSIVGGSFPLHCTANGKAILAQLPAAEVARILPDQLPAATPNTVTDLETLMAQLARLGPKGVFIDDEEHSVGICALGAAVAGTPLGKAAISVPIPAQRFAEKRAAAELALARTVLKIEQAFQS